MLEATPVDPRLKSLLYRGDDEIDWFPGDLIIVLSASLVDRLGAHEQHWTHCHQLGLIVQRSNRWQEPNRIQGAWRYYIVYFAQAAPQGVHDVLDSVGAGTTPGLYVIPGSRIVNPSEIKPTDDPRYPFQPTR